jgi:hypothetical protein
MAALNVPKFGALGILEAVWHFTGRYAPQGNIGKYTDQAIESWVGWNGRPGAMIEELIRCRWIDQDPVHRLLVHDWHQHADKATKNALGRAELSFCTPTVRTPSVRRPYKKPESSTASRLPEPVPEPEPGPEPVPEPEPEFPAKDSGKEKSSDQARVSSSKGKPSKVVDPRTGVFKDFFTRYYKQQVKAKPPWDGQEGAGLKKFLEANPEITQDDWQRILDNRTNSPGINHAARLSAWINRTALSWLNGLADDWGKPITQDRNSRKTPASQKLSEIDHQSSYGLKDNVGKWQ